MNTITPEALDYTPGELDRTAPARIWLQVDSSSMHDFRTDPFPEDHAEVTWEAQSVGGLEVQYVRADLAAQIAPPAPAAVPVGHVSVIQQDANNYCLILRLLGMEDEGDPVAEVRQLVEARDTQPAAPAPEVPNA
ncbi:hypothetical protein AB8810_10890 [Xanthomonas sp. NCPPB 3005]|uniref:hypothetical protein n=1 Tax=Xanthomonas sp. NCPPB 3005 TaxID=3240913 RepID=UPI0035184EEA